MAADDEVTGLAAEVTSERVHGLLIGRAPGILDETSPDYDLFLQVVQGVSSEVVPVVGDDPQDVAIRAEAIWCISLGVASHIEAAMFPEQQLGDDSRANRLLARYLGVLADLRSRGTGNDGPSPRGSFPPPPWRDPLYPGAYLVPEPGIYVPPARWLW